jgi:peptidyl-prolyl cis-trans isomerase D
LDYLLVDTVKLRREIEIPDDEIQAYWEANPSEFEREEQVRARHILIKKTPDRDENAAKAEIEAIRARIEGGEDFAALAQEVSEDEGTAARGGNLGYFSRGQMVKAFEDAAFGAEAGNLVGPVVSSFGVHLIEVQDKRAGGVQPLDQAKVGIRARLLGERVEQIARDKINDIAKRITDEKLTTKEQLQTLADEEGEPVTHETTDPFAQGEAIVGIGRVPELDEAAFSLDAGAISDPIKVPRGWAIVRVAEILEPRVQDLSEVADTVRQAVELEKQKDAAVERLAQARAQIAEGGDLQAVAAELGLEVTDSQPFGLQGNIAQIGRNPAVNEAALSMDVGEISEPIATNLGAVLFEVVERQKFDPETFEAEKAETLERERQQRSSQILDAIVEERRRDLIPKYDARLVEEYGLGDQST